MKKTTMKKRKKIFTVSIILTLLLSIGIFLVYTFFYNINHLPQGDFLSESTSPDGTYTIKTYLCPRRGRENSFAVRAELIINSEPDKIKNIYWDYRVKDANITWEDGETVIINKHKLTLPNDKYDWRN